MTSPSPRPAAPRLIATDLDGTLLRDDTSVSPRTVRALAEAEAAGIDVFFVTGRPIRWMHPVKDYVHGHGMAVCSNGAAVVDLAAPLGQQRFLKVRELPTDAARETVSLLRTAVPDVQFAVERTGSGLQHEPGYPRRYPDAGDSVAPVEKLLDDAGEGPVLKMLVAGPGQEPDPFLAVARLALENTASVTRSGPSALLEISALGVSKASTLEECCTERGIRPEEVVAFGDMPNDIEMLTWAGAGYAMDNAHPSVLAAAPHRTLSNEEDGVAHVIEEILRSR